MPDGESLCRGSQGRFRDLLHGSFKEAAGSEIGRHGISGIGINGEWSGNKISVMIGDLDHGAMNIDVHIGDAGSGVGAIDELGPAGAFVGTVGFDAGIAVKY